MPSSEKGQEEIVWVSYCYIVVMLGVTFDSIVILGITSDVIVILCVTFDAKMTFEKNLCSVSRAETLELGIMRTSWQVFHDRSLLLRSFWSFIFPVLEYCSIAWGLAKAFCELQKALAQLPIHTN